jgi:thioredoxin-like negative regulator of GroEL
MREEQIGSENLAIVSAFWQKADQATAQDKREEARAWMEGIVELDDRNIDAWLKLASLIPDARERMQCYARVLELSPGNAEAKAGLRQARRGG